MVKSMVKLCLPEFSDFTRLSFSLPYSLVKILLQKAPEKEEKYESSVVENKFKGRRWHGFKDRLIRYNINNQLICNLSG